MCIRDSHSGLLIFTNDKKMSAKLSHPKHEVKKIYHISLSNPLKSVDFKKMKDGLIVDRGVPKDLITKYGRKNLEEVFLEIIRNKNEF